MESNNQKECLSKFWTPKKCGKSGDPADFIDQHDMILNETLLVSPEDLLEQLNENEFTFQKFDLIPWTDFLKRADLAEYLKPDYIKYALDVTTSRPAIGKGEFLFVSCFSNLGFASGKGDIIDLRNNQICEFKGIRSTLSSDGKIYKQMDKSVIYSIFALFEMGTQHDHFNRKCASDIDQMLEDRPELLEKVLELLQNVQEPLMDFVRVFADLYRVKKDIFNVVGAMQLSIYMKNQKASYILFTNEDGFCCFDAPKSAEEAFNIVKGLKLSSWQTGDYGMTIGI